MTSKFRRSSTLKATSSFPQMWLLIPARVLKLEYSSEHAQVQNSKDSSQIECSIWLLHQRAISNYIYIYIYIFNK